MLVNPLLRFPTPFGMKNVRRNPQLFQDVQQIENQENSWDVLQSAKLQRALPVSHNDMRLGARWIANGHLLAHFLDDVVLAFFQARPNTFLLGLRTLGSL